MLVKILYLSFLSFSLSLGAMENREEDVLNQYIENKNKEGRVSNEVLQCLLKVNYSSFYKSTKANRVMIWLHEYIQKESHCRDDVGLCCVYNYKVSDLLKNKVKDRKKEYISLFKDVFDKETQGGTLQDVFDFLQLKENQKDLVLKKFNINSAGQNSWSWTFGRLGCVLKNEEMAFSVAVDIHNCISGQPFSVVLNYAVFMKCLVDHFGCNLRALTPFDYQLIAVASVIKGVGYYNNLLRILAGIKQHALGTIRTASDIELKEKKRKRFLVTDSDLRIEKKKGLLKKQVSKSSVTTENELHHLMEATTEIKDILQWLREHDLKLDFQDSRFGYSPLSIVVMKYPLLELSEKDKNDQYVLLQLITNNNISKMNKRGETPLYYALERAIYVLQEAYCARIKEKSEYIQDIQEIGTVVAQKEIDYLNQFDKWIKVIIFLKTNGAKLDEKSKK